MFRESLLVAQKDLRIERRSKVAISQIAPFALTILLIFGFALDADRDVLARVSSGLFWVAVLLSSVLAVQRSFAIESSDGARDGLRLSGLDPAAIFMGKASAIIIQLLMLEAILAIGVFILYGVTVTQAALLFVTCICATVGLAAAGTIYGVLAAGERMRETLLPLLMLPVVAPVLLCAARATEAGIDETLIDGWQWLRFLIVFAVVYCAAGIAAFGPLLEDS